MSEKKQNSSNQLAKITPAKKKFRVDQDGRLLEQNDDIPKSAENSNDINRNIELTVLLVLSQILKEQVPVEEMYQLKKKSGKTIGPGELADLVSQCFNVETKIFNLKLGRVDSIKTPTILICKNNSFRIVYRELEGALSIFDPVSKKKYEFKKELINEIYTGRSISIKSLNHKRISTSFAAPEGKFNAFWLIRTITQFKTVFIQVLIAALLIQIFALVTPLFTMVIIDKVFSTSGFSTLHVLIIGLFAISIFDYLISSTRQVLLNSVTYKIDYILATTFFKRLTALPLAFFSSKQIGDSVSRVKELEVIRSFFTGSAFMLLIDFPFLFVFIGMMLMFSVKLTIIASLFISVVMITYGVFAPFIQERLKGKNKVQTDNNSFLIETISGIEAIKSMSLESKAQQRWNKLLIDNARNSAKTEKMTGQISQFTGFLTKSTTAVCLWLGAILVLDGNLTPGQLIAFNMMVGRVIAPTQRISQILQQLNQLKISMRRVGEIMNASPELHIQKTSQLPSLKGRIKIENVSFRYGSEGKEVLKNISIDIQPSEVICLAGATGSGKTTLLRLLQRLHLPNDGNIYIDGINVLGINPYWFRKNIGVVSQENVLFNLSIIENIRLAHLGREEVSVDKIVHVCKLVGADSWIGRLPNAYDTVVGERGSFLSGGQRQQISIARALLRDPRILLLDEATSALDNESEAIVEANMKKIFEGRTVIMVAHHLPPRNLIDRIITLSDGQLEQENELQATSTTSKSSVAQTV